MTNLQAQSPQPLNYARAVRSTGWRDLLAWMVVLFFASVLGGFIGYGVAPVRYTSIGYVSVGISPNTQVGQTSTSAQAMTQLAATITSPQALSAASNVLKSKGISLSVAELQAGATVAYIRNTALISVGYTSRNRAVVAPAASAMITNMTILNPNAVIVAAPVVPSTGHTRAGPAALGTIAGFVLATLGLFYCQFWSGRYRPPAGRPIDL